MQAGVKNPRWWLTSTGNSYISACMQRNCKTIMVILKTILYIVLCEQIHKSKMVSQKQQILISCIQCSCTIPTSILMFSRSRNSTRLFSILCDASGSQKSEIAAYKPEKLIYQSLYNITGQFQLPHLCFQGPRIQ